MSGAKRKFRLKHGLALVVSIALIAGLAVVYVIATGLADHWARQTIVEQLEKTTGARVELGNFHFEWRTLGARFDGLTLRGNEPEGTPPLFHADRLDVGIHVDSFWGRKISVGSVEMTHFLAHVRIEPNGSTNIPGPSAFPIQSIFVLKIARLRLVDGEILWNDTRVPLAAEGGIFEFSMEHGDDGGRAVYLGRVTWQQFEIAALRFLPFASDLSAKFTLRPDSLSLTQLQWKIPHSEIDAQAELPSFAQPAWTFRYRGQFGFEDLRTIMRQPDAPRGLVGFTGEGHYANQQVSVTGRYTSSQILMNYMWFHPGNISAHGSYRADQNSLDLPDLEALALGGSATSNVHLDIPKQDFRAETKIRGMDLRQALAAEDNPNLPIVPLHWGSRVDVDATTTWASYFKHLDSRGVMLWTPPSTPEPGEIPATARFEYHYEMDRQQVQLEPGEIVTPSSLVVFRGALSMIDSSLDLTIDTQDLTVWDDFINRIRGVDVKPETIGGHAHWLGRLTGRLDSPTFKGHIKGNEAQYGTLFWDELEGDLTYSQNQLLFERAHVRRGSSLADLELALVLNEWDFSANDGWTLDLDLSGADTNDLQKLVGTAYPAQGLLSGQFHGKGTRAAPEFSGLFDLSNATAGSLRFDRARGQLTMRNGEVRISNAEVRLPMYAPGTPSGVLTGNIDYHGNTQEVSFDLAGAAIPLEAIGKIQTASLPVGGRLNLQVRGQGPLMAPEMHATLRLIDLKLGGTVVGSFDGKVDSDGHHLSATIESAMAAGRLSGKMDVTLGGDYPISAEVTAERIVFDPFLVSAMRLSHLDVHSLVDGHFAIAGFAAHPETIAVECNLSRITIDLEKINLENVGPVRLTYRQDEVRVEQASLRGPDTNFRIGGSARFAGDRALNLRLDGEASLQLLGSFVPRLESNGRAQVNAAIAGTLASPRFNGKVHIDGVSLRYGDFPAGLSNVAGDFNFDASRIVFDNVTAESGGGRLNLGGTVSYAGGSLNYTVNARTDQVRIRYPLGMSWLVAGNLRLSGTDQASTLSGRLVVDRLLMAQGFDISGIFASSKGSVTSSATAASFLQNMQFDIQVESSPDSRIEWTGARLQTDASLRMRATWEHPILQGHIHLLSGEMSFRGNQYTIARGDINFSNPFRLDPVLNMEATTTIRQYEVTLDFTGPMSRLTLSYRSDPPLPSSDIIALLALGQTGQESAQRTTTGQSAGVGASTVLSEAISSQLGTRIQRLFGISHFSVGPSVTGVTVEQNSIASVTVEQQVSRGLVVTYITDVTTTQYQVIQIEYAINREFSVIALRDENGTFGVDVVRKTRFK